MIYELLADDKILNSANVKKDEILHNVLFGNILPNEHDIALTNGRSVVIGRTNKELGMWIWTSDDITTTEYNELMAYIPSLFENGETVGFFAEYPVADDIIALVGGEIISTSGLISYRCDNVISPKPTGIIRHPQASEVNIIAEFLNRFHIDCNLHNGIDNPEVYIERAKSLIDYEYFYVLESDGIIVAMCNMVRYEKYMRIASVYTAVEHRNKGHAAYLTSELCKIAHKIGKLPILYADEFYPPSNKAYRNIGFTECGRLKQIKMVKR